MILSPNPDPNPNLKGPNPKLYQRIEKAVNYNKEKQISWNYNCVGT